MRKLSITGQRHCLFGGVSSGTPAVQYIKSELQKTVTRALDKGFRHFISGGDIGVGLWSAEFVLRQKLEHPEIRLTIARPYPSFHHSWPGDPKIEFERQMDKADDVLDISDNGFEHWKIEKRNQWMVDASDCLVAVWDGRKSFWPKDEGQTYKMVEYAWNNGKPTIIIDYVKMERWVLRGKKHFSNSERKETKLWTIL